MACKLSEARKITGGIARDKNSESDSMDPLLQYLGLGGPSVTPWRLHSVLRSTRLALQLFLVEGVKLYSIQLQDPKEPCISVSITANLR
jgi:hypothetical protein